MELGRSGTELRQIKVLGSEDEALQRRDFRSGDLQVVFDTDTAAESIKYSLGHCRHNRKFACVFIPCSLPLLVIGGELLFGVIVLCLLVIYLVDNTSRNKKSVISVFVISVVVLQLTSVYCLFPLVWKSIFNIGLIFIYNVFIVLSGGVGLLQFKQFQDREPQFVVQVEYILFISYPITGQFTLTLVTSAVVGLWSVPYLCIIFGFLMLQIFYPSSQSSFIYYDTVHKPGEEKPTNHFILGPIEKTVLLFNLLSVPGSLFIIINILEFLSLITWVKLIFCGVFPLFLCTCLNIKDEVEFLDIDQNLVTQVKWGSGLASLILFCCILCFNGVIPLSMLPLIIASSFCALLVGITAGRNWKKMYFYMSCAFSSVVYLVALATVPATLQSTFKLFSLPLWLVTVLLALVSLLSVACVVAAYSRREEWLNALLLLNSLVFVLCENILVADKSYPVYCMLATGGAMPYVVWRLHNSAKLNWYSGCLCIAIHGSKLPRFVSSLVPPGYQSSVVLPATLQISPALMSFIFTFVLAHSLGRGSKDKITAAEGVKWSLYSGLAVLCVYDALVAPVWFLLTREVPSHADALATILFLWGVLCVKMSYVHLAHNLNVRRLNILVFCTAVFVEVLQPDLGFYKILYSFPVYIVSLVIPVYSSAHIILAESIVLPWFLLVAMVTLAAASTKLIRLQQYSSLHRGLVSTLIGLPVGLKIATQLLGEARPPLVSLLYGVSAGLLVYLFIASWVPNIGELRAALWPVYLALVICFVCSAVLEHIVLEEQIIPKVGTSTEPNRVSSTSPCIFYHALLHVLLVCGLKREGVTQDETLETKGERTLSRTFQSSSFYANISVVVAFFCALPCLPSEYLDLTITLDSLLFLLLRPEGMPFIEGKRFKLNSFLPTNVAFTVFMYQRTLAAIFPEQFSILSLLGFFLECLILHLSLPTHIVCMHALWQQNIASWEEQVTMFVAPSNVVLLVYCSTLPGRILAVGGLVSTYWTFYHGKEAR